VKGKMQVSNKRAGRERAGRGGPDIEVRCGHETSTAASRATASRGPRFEWRRSMISCGQ